MQNPRPPFEETNVFPPKQLSETHPDLHLTTTRKVRNKLMAEKAKNYVWGRSFEAFPPQSVFSYSPDSICTMHNSLIQKNVNPVDNIYGQLPSTLLLNRRFNVQHNRKGHLVHTKRELDSRKASDYTKISNFRAKWKQMGNPVKVCGKNGQDTFTLVLSHGPEGVVSVAGEWVAEEFISVNCQKRDTAIVFLKCTNPKLNRAESKLERTEYRLQELCQKKFAESEPSAIEELDKSIYDCQVALGECITEVEVLRELIKHNEDVKAGAVGSSVESTAIVDSSVGALNARDLLYGPTVPAPTFRDTAETSEDCDTCMEGKEIGQPKISDPKLSENETSIVGFEPQNATPEALSIGFEYSSAYGVSELSGVSHASKHLLRVDGSSHRMQDHDAAKLRKIDCFRGTTSQVQGSTVWNARLRLSGSSLEAAHANSAKSMQSMHNEPTDSVSPIPEDSIRAGTSGSNRCKRTRLNTDTRLPAATHVDTFEIVAVNILSFEGSSGNDERPDRIERSERNWP
ncbi:hypothetical protein Tco_0460847 [Tanacetum coccineum]